MVLVYTTACGGSTNVGQRAVSDDGAAAASAGGGAGTGAASSGGAAGSGGKASGGSSPGGSGGRVVATGGSSGGAVAAGGAGGQESLCLGSDGQLRLDLKRCSSNVDCTTLRIATCCGSDQVVGIQQGSSCTLPAIDCSGLGCAKSLYATAEDQMTTESGGTIGVRCDTPGSGLGICRSFVVAPMDGGTTPCGAQTCGGNQVCALPPTNVGPIQGAPYCVDIPPSCSDPLTCSCFAPEVCGGGAKFCFSIAGHEMQCLFAP